MVLSNSAERLSALNRFVCQRVFGCNPFPVADAITHLTNRRSLLLGGNLSLLTRDPATLKVASSGGRLRWIAPDRRSVFYPIPPAETRSFWHFAHECSLHVEVVPRPDRCRVGSRIINTSLGVRTPKRESWIWISFITLFSMLNLGVMVESLSQFVGTDCRNNLLC